MSKVDMKLSVMHYANNNAPIKGVFIPDSLRREAIAARHFLQSHPAIGNCDHACDELYYMMMEVCKRGVSEAGPITVWNTPTNRKKFAKDFNKQFCKDELDKNRLCSIYKKYEEVYGEPWVFDHVEFWWETTFHVYHGSVDRDSKEWMDTKKWQSYSHGEAGTLTIEEAFIDAAKFAKETLGDFGYNSFVTEAEKENHKKYNAFNFTKSEHYILNKFTGKREACKTMNHNNKYLWVSNGMENRRWLKWFVETPYCKKNWGKDFKGLAKIQPPND